MDIEAKGPKTDTAVHEIYVVDDDPAVRATLSIILTGAGYKVVCFSDGASLMATARYRSPLCILLDVNIPGKSGMDILQELHDQKYQAPIFIISGFGDISMAVAAIKAGAFDFIEKPFSHNDILQRIADVVGTSRQHCKRVGGKALNFPGREPLTPREREVLELCSSGLSNKEVGRQLGISPRTVEDHRANLMRKLGAKNSTELIRLVMETVRVAR